MGNPIENARVRTGRYGEKGEAGNLDAHCAALATKAAKASATVPYLMTHQAKRTAVRILTGSWLDILAVRRGERVI